jgi:polysaccharide deacetylase family protein (PEP-CTERM system associated)
MTQLLFSIDLEWFYAANGRRDLTQTPLPNLVGRLLALLAETKHKATFFTVGELARAYPDVIARIAEQGHELGCHGDRHLPLNELGADEFKYDLEANRRALSAAGVMEIRGFRAPLFSLTASTPWAHKTLRDAGFTYSSSVLPAANPLFGWPEFGAVPREVDGLWEIPITTDRMGFITAPLYGGTYLRVLPWMVLRRKLLGKLNRQLIQSYVHPYDFDFRQAWAMHAGLRGKPYMNCLLFLRRAGFENRVRWILSNTRKSATYHQFVGTLRPSP